MVFPEPCLSTHVVLQGLVFGQTISLLINGQGSASGRVNSNADDTHGAEPRIVFFGILDCLLDCKAETAQIITWTLSRQIGLMPIEYHPIIAARIGDGGLG